MIHIILETCVLCFLEPLEIEIELENQPFTESVCGLTGVYHIWQSNSINPNSWLCGVRGAEPLVRSFITIPPEGRWLGHGKRVRPERFASGSRPLGCNGSTSAAWSTETSSSQAMRCGDMVGLTKSWGYMISVGMSSRMDKTNSIPNCLIHDIHGGCLHGLFTFSTEHVLLLDVVGGPLKHKNWMTPWHAADIFPEGDFESATRVVRLMNPCHEFLVALTLQSLHL